MRARLDRLRDLHRVVKYANVLNRDNGIGSGGHDCSRRDGHGTARFELPAERPARGGLADDAQAPRQIGRAHGETVHRRARERRQIDARMHVLRADAPARLGNRHGLHREPAGVPQHPLAAPPRG